MGSLFFWSRAVGVACIFLRLILLSGASFPVLSQSESCLFTLLIVSLIMQKLVSFKFRSHLFVFAFISITLGGGS